ncbi:MAG: cytidine deaminase [Alphaproteobacteria bacterium]|jgi:cytidine deaminase|nr:cytidine deaminase [Alphaproteobacteria bacterium]
MSEHLERMIDLAREVRERAYAPYSGFKVGAVVRTPEGDLHTGTNVENSSYPQGWCAEASAISAMVAAGDQQIAEVVVLGDGERLCTPCGGCRQKLREFANGETPVHICGPEGHRRTVTLGELMPLAFGPENLE